MSILFLDDYEKIALGNLEHICSELKALKKHANETDSEDENLQIWKRLKEIVELLEMRETTQLPYARKYYPICIKLCKEIRTTLKKNLERSPDKPKSWKLFYFEK